MLENGCIESIALPPNQGMQLVIESDINAAVAEVKAIGATIVSQGEFRPGYPFLHILDPDGNQIEIWFE